MPSSNILFVTGGDAEFFSQILLLLGSVEMRNPTLPLLVCDFGLTAEQQNFLRRKQILIERPAELIPPRHPWDNKAQLLRFIDHLPFDSVAWIDADIIVTDDLHSHFVALDADMAAKNEIIAAPSGAPIGDVLQNMGPNSRNELERHSPANPYMSAGFFLCRSRPFLQAWHNRTLAAPLEMLYEQNAFNITAFEMRGYRPLAERIWNCPGNELENLTIIGNDSGNSTDLRFTDSVTGQTTLSLHVTSTNRARDLMTLVQTFKFGDGLWDTSLRLFRQQGLMEYQKQFLYGALRQNFDLIVESGLAKPMPPAPAA